ncbi:MAG TPA: glycosyltransferase family 4 protein, partial [Terriglobales bacterium]
TGAKRNRVPFLLWCESTSHDRRNRRSVVESLKMKFFRSCDGFVVPGKSSYEYVSQMNSKISTALSVPIFIAPNAVDNDLFSEGARRAASMSVRLRGRLGFPERYFLSVGRLVEQKGVLDLLNAYASLSPDLRTKVGLVFAGDGPLRSELENSARYIFPGSVHFPGFIQRDELAAYYSLAECFVLPTHSDPWGLVVNEAMACGLPIICTAVAGCAADLVLGNGRVVGSRNTRQLAGAMEEISADPDLRLRMSEESRKLIQKYSPQACADGIGRAAILTPPFESNGGSHGFAFQHAVQGEPGDDASSRT